MSRASSSRNLNHFYMWNFQKARKSLLLNYWQLTRSHFFYYDKSQNGKRYPFANYNLFWHLIWKTFCHLDRANSIETDLQTFKLQTGRFITKLQVCKKVSIKPSFNYIRPIQMAKCSHLGVNIFCHFNFCHDRRNDFSLLYWYEHVDMQICQ